MTLTLLWLKTTIISGFKGINEEDLRMKKHETFVGVGLSDEDALCRFRKKYFADFGFKSFRYDKETGMAWLNGEG